MVVVISGLTIRGSENGGKHQTSLSLIHALIVGYNFYQESILPNFFFVLEHPFFAIKLGHFLFYKHSILTTKIGKQRKTKFGRIDSWTNSLRKLSMIQSLCVVITFNSINTKLSMSLLNSGLNREDFSIAKFHIWPSIDML